MRLSHIRLLCLLRLQCHMYVFHLVLRLPDYICVFLLVSPHLPFSLPLPLCNSRLSLCSLISWHLNRLYSFLPAALLPSVDRLKTQWNQDTMLQYMANWSYWDQLAILTHHAYCDKCDVSESLRAYDNKPRWPWHHIQKKYFLANSSPVYITQKSMTHKFKIEKFKMLWCAVHPVAIKGKKRCFHMFC